MSPLEIAANGLIAISIVLAGRNSVHTWSVGILGCALFAWLFFTVQLYADAVLQLAFIATGAAGWWWWLRGRSGAPPPIVRERLATMVALVALSIAVAVAYGTLLHAFTDAYAPFLDSFVLTLSLFAQFLLVRRKVETWPIWLLVNTIAVPLFFSRGLYLTSALYAAYWLHAWYGWWRWSRDLRS